MERRKFMIGVGSLVAGSTAMMGTGAFSNISAERNADMVIEPDSTSPFLRLDAPNSLENGEYALGSDEWNGDQLKITLNGKSDVLGEGLVADAEQWFDSVFRIANMGSQTVQVFVDDDRLPFSDRVIFYTGQADPNQSLGGIEPIEGQPTSGSPGAFDEDEDEESKEVGNHEYWAELAPGTLVEVGIYVDTNGLNTAQDLNTNGETIDVKAREP